MQGELRKNGQPLTNVLVTFVPNRKGSDAHVRSMGLTDDAGRFSLMCESQQPGAVLGEHVVVLEDMAIYHAPRSGDGTLLKRPHKRFPEVYGNPLRSPLKVTVTPGLAPVELNVDP